MPITKPKGYLKGILYNFYSRGGFTLPKVHTCEQFSVSFIPGDSTFGIFQKSYPVSLVFRYGNEPTFFNVVPRKLRGNSSEYLDRIKKFKSNHKTADPLNYAAYRYKARASMRKMFLEHLDKKITKRPKEYAGTFIFTLFCVPTSSTMKIFDQNLEKALDRLPIVKGHIQKKTMELEKRNHHLFRNIVQNLVIERNVYNAWSLNVFANSDMIAENLLRNVKLCERLRLDPRKVKMSLQKKRVTGLGHEADFIEALKNSSFRV